MASERLAELNASTAQIAAAERLATALIVGFQLCADEQQPLNELQRIALVKAGLLVFNGFREDVDSQVRVGAVLTALGGERHRAASNGRRGAS